MIKAYGVANQNNKISIGVWRIAKKVQRTHAHFHIL